MWRNEKWRHLKAFIYATIAMFIFTYENIWYDMMIIILKYHFGLWYFMFYGTLDGYSDPLENESKVS